MSAVNRDLLSLNEREGFTLLELLIVLLIVAIGAGLVGFGIGGGLENLRLKTSAKHLLAIMRHARDQAASLKTNTSVIVDQETKSVALSVGSGGDEGEKGSKSYKFPEDVIVKEGYNFQFMPSGGSSGGEVVLENKRGRSYKIRLDRLTGVPRLIEGGTEG